MSSPDSNEIEEFLNSGKIILNLPIQPVSAQSARIKKDELKEKIRQAVYNYQFILIGDVKVNIVWNVHSQERYESDSSADVDNIIKPILDSLDGIEGVFIDDCQVQSIYCSWSYVENSNQSLVIEISMLDDDQWIDRNDLWAIKESLFFVRVKNALCYPLFESTPRKILLELKYLEELFEFREHIIQRNLTYGENNLMPFYFAHQPKRRLFHKSRIKDFEIRELDDVKEEQLRL